MTRGPLVSIVVPARDAEAFLGEALASVRRQGWRELEAIVVDDGSRDRTAELAARAAAEDGRIRLLRIENAGVSAARNRGIAAARGELMCFLDADDVLLPDKLERQVAFLDFFPGCDLVYSDHYIGDAQLRPLRLDCRAFPPVPAAELFAYRNWFAPMAPLLRTALVRRIGGFDESLRGGEDWDFWIRASRAGVIGYLPGPVGVYRTHPGQAHRNLEMMRTDQEKVIRKNYPPGTRESRIARSVMAWSRAQLAWADGEVAATAGHLLRCLWHARSRRILRSISKFGGY